MKLGDSRVSHIVMSKLNVTARKYIVIPKYKESADTILGQKKVVQLYNVFKPHWPVNTNVLYCETFLAERFLLLLL